MDIDQNEVRATFQLSEGLYVLGSFEPGLTVYSQQVRAHNLAWSLSDRLNRCNGLVRIAVVGGGIAGMTVAAAITAISPNAEVYLLERRSHLCPLQLGCDTRWLHPRIYDWPKPGSRTPSASLPVLNWKENRASDVAHQLLRAFEGGLTESRRKRLRVYLGVEHLRIDPEQRTCEWIGAHAKTFGGRLHMRRREGIKSNFEAIVVAAGFGIETAPAGSSTFSYWRNESIAQPILDGSVHRYAISGYGDGALVDLCRLAIERFRQDRILDEIFEDRIDAIEDSISGELVGLGTPTNWFSIFAQLEKTYLAGAVDKIRYRLRSDTNIVMHLGGKDATNKTIEDAFGGKASFANRMMFYLLFRCGAFTPIFSDFPNWLDKRAIETDHVIWRHGANAASHVASLFADPDGAAAQIETFRSSRLAQRTDRYYPFGFFPPDFQGRSV